MIKPTVGRVVWYRPSPFDHDQMTIHAGGQPLAAIVAYVWSDTMVNLTVSDHSGATHKRTSVYLDQGEGAGQSSPYCEWMPYQKGQAAKSHAAEAAADAAALDVSALAPKRLPAGMTVAEGYRLVEGPDDPIGQAEPINRVCIHPAFERDDKFGVIRCTKCRMETGRIGGVGDPGRPVPHHGSGP